MLKLGTLCLNWAQLNRDHYLHHYYC